VIDIESLEAMADWKESLQARIRHARFRYELIGAGREEVIELGAEVEDFKQAVRVLKQVS
jgi:hypothetical protein